MPSSSHRTTVVQSASGTDRQPVDAAAQLTGRNTRTTPAKRGVNRNVTVRRSRTAGSVPVASATTSICTSTSPSRGPSAGGTTPIDAGKRSVPAPPAVRDARTMLPAMALGSRTSTKSDAARDEGRSVSITINACVGAYVHPATTESHTASPIAARTTGRT